MENSKYSVKLKVNLKVELMRKLETDPQTVVDTVRNGIHRALLAQLSDVDNHIGIGISTLDGISISLYSKSETGIKFLMEMSR